MDDQSKRIRNAEQANDDLLVRLLRGEPIKDDFVGPYRPPYTKDECDGMKTVQRDGRLWIIPRQWRKSELAFKKRWGPGFILSQDAREAIKHAYDHGDGPPWKLRDWMRSLLDTAWSHWCRAVDQGQTKDPFRIWIRDYLLEEDWFERLALGTLWGEAAQLLRLSLNLPRIRPLSTREV